MKRLIALDMLRGYALVCIMIDHMPVSPLRRFTLTNFVVFDAAELFVLLSGFLVGLVWLSVQTREGTRAAQRRFARRAVEVWLALILGGLLLALLSAGLFALDMHHTAIWWQYAVWVIENPLGYLGTLATLWLQPNLVDVLAVYVVLLASVVLLVPLLRRWPLAFAVGSVLIWWFAAPLNAQLPNHRPAGGLLFNPFAWQLLFFSGVAMGLFRKDFMPFLQRYSRLLTVISLGIFAFSAAIVIAAHIGPPAQDLRDMLALLHGGRIDKWNMDFTRYLAIMACSWLVAMPLAPVMERLAASPPGVALQQIGRGGLWSFIICVLLSILGDAFQMNPAGQASWRRLLVDIWVMAALWWASVMWLTRAAPGWKARRNPPANPPASPQVRGRWPKSAGHNRPGPDASRGDS